MPTEVVKYVDPDMGVLADYPSLQAAITAEKAIRSDLVARDEVLKLMCISSAGSPDTTPVVIGSGSFTTNDDCKIIVQGNNLSGLKNDVAYRLVSNSITFNIADNINIDLHNLQMIIGIGSGQFYGIFISAAAPATVNIYNTIIFGGGGTKGRIPVNVYGASHTVLLQNCVLDGFTVVWDSGIQCNNGSSVISYNCIYYNNSIICRIISGTFIIINSIALNSGSISGTPSGDYNLSNLSGMPGGNSVIAAALFADASAGDFRLLPGSPGIDQGVDLSADANYPFNTAIDGTLRPQGAAWDIGAFELIQQSFNPAWARQANKIIRAI